MHRLRNRVAPWLSTAAVLLSAFAAPAQTPAGSLNGVVADSTGAVVPGATIALSGTRSFAATAVSDAQGRYEFTGLAAGEYRIEVVVAGFERYEATRLRVTAGRALTHAIALRLSSVKSEITVGEQGQVDVDAGSSAGAVVIQGESLKALSNTRDTLEEDLQALAGPSVGPGGGEIFVDGFSGGKLPSKASIREIRVNSNPFSAEYDRLGYGRVEIFTKPGTDKLRGEAGFNFGDDLFNARNPYALDKPPYQRRMLEGNVSGPLSRRASFYLAVERFTIEETTVINALTLDASLNPSPFRTSIVAPRNMTEIEGRIDYRLSANHTLVGRVFTEGRTFENAGLDTFTLPTRAETQKNRETTIQLTETGLIGPSTVHEIRAQYSRDVTTGVPASTATGVEVPDAFIGGSGQAGNSRSKDGRFEFTDLLSLSRGSHMLKIGGRARTGRQTDLSLRDYNGSFLFSTLDAYGITEAGLAAGVSPVEIRATGGGAAQFTLTAGDPFVAVRQTDAGIYAQDEWRIHPRFTLTTGLRYETQTNIEGRGDFAPRIGIAWAPGRGAGNRSAGVLRAGFGMFYERVNPGLTMDALRLDGSRQRQYVVPAPDFFPNVPPPEALSGNVADQATRVVDRNLRAPYIAQVAVTYERNLPGNSTLSLTYSNARGVRVLRSRNINAPLPGTYDPLNPESAIRPGPGGNVYSYESSGFFRQTQVLANWNSRVNRRLTLLGYYVWGKAYSDSDGAGSFPANSYNLAGEYARAGFDVRHRVMVAGNLAAPYGLMLNPLVTASSGIPFNITAGPDLNGDSIFNDRPAIATDLARPSVVRTAYGAFDLAPLPGQAIAARNLGNGPGQVSVNLRLSRSFGFGEISSGGDGPASESEHHGGQHGGPPGGAPGAPGGGHGPGDDHGRGSSDRRYTVTFSVAARNLLNTTNSAPPVGNLSSPLFGTSVALASSGHRGPGSTGANRSLEMSVRFSF